MKSHMANRVNVSNMTYVSPLPWVLMCARKSSGRNIHGVLLLDKPQGKSSNAALQEIKTLFRARKAGHTGSLDPLATGVLPICFGEATKLASFLLDTDKRYRVSARLGVLTETGDAEGNIIERRCVPNLSQADIQSVFSRFTGEISQIPPMFSALKHKGTRLYDLARRGIVVDREARVIRINELKFTKLNNDLLEFEVYCSKGTYIRTLVEDIGKFIECGAFVEKLRRTQVGCFDIKQAWNTIQLKEMKDDEELLTCLLPVDKAIDAWPSIKLSQQLAYSVSCGQSVPAPVSSLPGMVRFYNEDAVFWGIGEILDNGKIAPRRLFKNASNG